MTDFHLTSPESSVDIASEAVQTIRDTLAETRDKGIVSALGFDQLGMRLMFSESSTNWRRSTAASSAVPMTAMRRRAEVFERRDAPDVVDGGWLSVLRRRAATLHGFIVYRPALPAARSAVPASR